MNRDDIIRMGVGARLITSVIVKTPVGDFQTTGLEFVPADLALDGLQRFHDLATAEDRRLRQASELMAGCMDMVRQDLIAAGVIDATVPPMMVPEAVMAALQRAVADEREACAKVCDQRKDQSRNHLVRSGLAVAALDIRARGMP